MCRPLKGLTAIAHLSPFGSKLGLLVTLALPCTSLGWKKSLSWAQLDGICWHIPLLSLEPVFPFKVPLAEAGVTWYSLPQWPAAKCYPVPLPERAATAWLGSGNVLPVSQAKGHTGIRTPDEGVTSHCCLFAHSPGQLQSVTCSYLATQGGLQGVESELSGPKHDIVGKTQTLEPTIRVQNPVQSLNNRSGYLTSVYFSFVIRKQGMTISSTE